MSDRLEMLKSYLMEYHARLNFELSQLEEAVMQYHSIKQDITQLEATIEHIKDFELGKDDPQSDELTAIGFVRRLFIENPDVDFYPGQIIDEMHNAFLRGGFKTRDGQFRKNLAYNILAQLTDREFIQRSIRESDKQTLYRKSHVAAESKKETPPVIIERLNQ